MIQSANNGSRASEAPGRAAGEGAPLESGSGVAPSEARSGRFVAMFLVLALLFAMGQFHRSSGGVLATVFAGEFDLPPDILGLVIGAMFVAQGAGQIPAGVLLDRFGTRLMAPGMSLFAVAGCFVVAGAQQWGVLLAGRVMIGFGFAAALMGSLSLLSRWAPPAALSTLTGRFLFLGLIGGIMATSPFAYVIETFGWRSAYVGMGLATLFAAGLAALVVRDVPPGARTRPSGPPMTLAEGWRGFLMVLRSRSLRPILVVAPVLYSPNQVLLGLWASPYLKDVHGLGTIERGHALTAMVVAMSLGVLAYGPIERFVNARRPVVAGGALCVCAAFVGLALAGGSSALVATALCVMAIVSSTFFVVVLAHAQSLFAVEFAGRVVSAIGVLAISGIFAFQFLTALLLSQFPGAAGTTASETGYRVMFAIMAAIYLGVALVYSRVPETAEGR